jgi:hypothetical protein
MDEIVFEIVFEVVQESDGGYAAECLSEDIFTQGQTWEELRANAIEAVKAFYFDTTPPSRIRLHLVRDEVVSPK